MAQLPIRSEDNSRILEIGPLVRLFCPATWYLAYRITTNATPKLEQDPAEARWIRLRRIVYTDPLGKKRVWETAERQVLTTNATARSCNKLIERRANAMHDI